MTTYLELHAARIQSYLARTDGLRHVRGASAMVSAAFAAVGTEVASGELRGVEAADDAPPIDGKLVVVVRDAEPATAAEALARRLRHHLPAVQIDASWAPASSWAALPPDPRRQHATYLRATTDLPLARRCEICRVDPARREVRVVADELLACDDCQAREAAHALTRARPLVPGRPPADFSALAQRGPAGDGRKTNHLATVYADGNRLGAAFRAAADTVADRLVLATGIANATVDAVAEAAAVVHQRAERLGSIGDDDALIVPHVVGGDDLLASLPAAYGLLFTITYLESFERLAAEAAARAGADGLRLTASAGLCIAHASYPFVESSGMATDLAGDAKASFYGEESSLGRIDLTTSAEPTSPPWTVAALRAAWDDVAALADAGRTRRSRIAHVLRDEGEGAVRRDARRLGDLDVVEPFTTPDPTLPLSAALELSRWWA